VLALVSTFGVHSIEVAKVAITKMIHMLNISKDNVKLIEVSKEPLLRQRIEIPNMLRFNSLDGYSFEKKENEESYTWCKGTIEL